MVPQDELLLQELYLRIAKLETEQADLVASRDQSVKQYGTLLFMIKELTINSSAAAKRASLAADKALLAGQLAARTARDSLIRGAIEVADVALDGAKAASEAAVEAAGAAVESRNAALLAAGHNADEELLRMSSQASYASKDAAQAAATALHVFSEAYDAVSKARDG